MHELAAPMVIQLFDRDGFYGAVTAETTAMVQELAAKRCISAPSLVACSLPFRGKMVEGWENVPDVSVPPEFRSALAGVDKELADVDKEKGS